MRSPDHQRVLFCLALLGLNGWFAQPCRAGERWKEASHAAFEFEIKEDYKQAAEAYQKALTLVPTEEANDRAKLEAALAVSLIKSKQYERGVNRGQQAVDMILSLKKQNKLDAEVLMNLQYLKDTCLQFERFPFPHDSRDRLIRQYNQLYLSIKTAIDPKESARTSERFAEARSFVAHQQDDLAMRELETILKDVKADALQYWPINLSIAALKAKHGHKEMLLQWQNKLRRTRSEIDVLCCTVNSQVWAADYPGAKATITMALSKVGKGNRQAILDEAQVQKSYASIFLDLGDGAQALPHLQRVVALYSTDERDRVALADAKRALAYDLRILNRVKEAEALTPDRNVKSDYEFMLTDEEKAALQKKQKNTPAR